MRIILQSLVFTLIFSTIELIDKRKVTMQKMLVFFLIVTGVLYTTNIFCEQAPSAKTEIKSLLHLFNDDALTSDQISFYRDKIEFHRQNAERTYNDAKEACWWLPNFDDRKKARYCFASAMAVVGSSSPMSKVIAYILYTLGEYGFACLDEWDYINNKLHWSQYHYEMKEFYEHILKG